MRKTSNDGLTDARSVDENIGKKGDDRFAQFCGDGQQVVVDEAFFGGLIFALFGFSHYLVASDADEFLVRNRDGLVSTFLQIFVSHLNHHETSGEEDRFEMAVTEAAEREEHLDGCRDAFVVACSSILNCSWSAKLRRKPRRGFRVHEEGRKHVVVEVIGSVNCRINGLAATEGVEERAGEIRLGKAAERDGAHGLALGERRNETVGSDTGTGVAKHNVNFSVAGAVEDESDCMASVLAISPTAREEEDFAFFQRLHFLGEVLAGKSETLLHVFVCVDGEAFAE